jgi:ABC-type Na+ efflux pump permease subunit
MDVSVSSWLLIAVALAAANLPFVNESLFGFIPLKGARKHAWTRVFELLVLYFVTGAAAYALEARIGDVFAQVKEFYMITVPLFVVLAFPGFVLRYLRKQHH